RQRLALRPRRPPRRPGHRGLLRPRRAPARGQHRPQRRPRLDQPRRAVRWLQALRARPGERSGGAGRVHRAQDHQVPGAMNREAGGSLAKLLAWRAAENPDAGFMFVEDDGPWTYGQLAAAAARIAAALNVAPGERVIVRVGNDERFLPAL